MADSSGFLRACCCVLASHPPRRIPDKEREICRGCVKSFGIMRRKHRQSWGGQAGELQRNGAERSGRKRAEAGDCSLTCACCCPSYLCLLAVFRSRLPWLWRHLLRALQQLQAAGEGFGAHSRDRRGARVRRLLRAPQRRRRRSAARCPCKKESNQRRCGSIVILGSGSVFRQCGNDRRGSGSALHR